MAAVLRCCFPVAVVFALSARYCKMFTEEFPEFAFLILCDFVWKATFLLHLLLNFAINMCLKPNGLTYDFRAHAL